MRVSEKGWQHVIRFPVLRRTSLPPDDAQRCKAKANRRVPKAPVQGVRVFVICQSLWLAALCAGRGRNKEERLSWFCYLFRASSL